MRLEVRRQRDGQWHVRARAANNRIVWHTEGYTRRADALRAARQRAAEMRGRVRVC